MPNNKVIWEITPWADLWSMPNGGGSPMHFELMKGLKSEGYTVVEVNPEYSRPINWLMRISSRFGVLGAVLNIGLQGCNLMAYTLSAMKKAPKHKPSLVYGYGSQSALATYILSRKHKVNSVTRLFGTFVSPRDSIVNLALKWQEVLAYKLPCSRLIITDDGTQGNEVAARLKVPESKLLFLENGVDEYKGQLQQHDGVVIVTSSRLVDWKRVDRLIKALPTVMARYPETKVKIVGDGGEKENLNALASKLSVNVEFVGAVSHDKALEYIANADIFVSTSDVSNVSNSLKEAMAAGKCIVTLDTGNTGSIIKDCVNGMLLPVTDTDGLSNALIAVVESKPMRDVFGQNAKEYAASHFPTWTQRVNTELGLINRLCND